MSPCRLYLSMHEKGSLLARPRYGTPVNDAPSVLRTGCVRFRINSIESERGKARRQWLAAVLDGQPTVMDLCDCIDERTKRLSLHMCCNQDENKKKALSIDSHARRDGWVARPQSGHHDVLLLCRPPRRRRLPRRHLRHNVGARNGALDRVGVGDEVDKCWERL